MARTRSPNYPIIDLAAAIDAVRPVFAKEVRNKMSRLVLAKHLGYATLNGRSLGMIGAVRAYGLIEGAGDEQRVSDDGITVISAPPNSPDRPKAFLRCAFRPTLFKELRENYENTPSEENLKYELVKRGFTPEAAGKAADTYLSTIRLVSAFGASEPLPSEPGKRDENIGDEIEVGDLINIERNGELLFQVPVRVRDVQENDGQLWVLPENTDSWTEVESVILASKGSGPARTPPPLPLPPPPTVKPGLHANAGTVVRTAVFPLMEGDATLTFPAVLSAESLNMLGHHLHLIIQQAQWAKKAAPILYPSAGVEGGGDHEGDD